MKKTTQLLLAIILIISNSLTAQVSVNTDGSSPDASAMLDVKSTNMGFLVPRVADTNAISSPAEGLQIYDLSSHCMRYYNGSEWSACMGGVWTCGDALVDSRDGQSYATIQIGTQCWMAENLNIGTIAYTYFGDNQSDNDTIEKFCFFNDISYCNAYYGGLYQWNEMMQYDTTEGIQGICPTGWHIPTDAEWCVLEQEVDSTITCSSTGTRGIDGGGKLKYPGTAHWQSPNTGATNSSGFTALPAGDWSLEYGFVDLTASTSIWSSNGYGLGAWSRGLGKSHAQVIRGYASQAYGFSVRCVRD